jgi:hypothetical protein
VTEPRRATIAEVATRELGPLRGGAVIAFMVMWQAAMAAADEWPEGLSDQVRAYSGWSLQSERTVWRHLKRFRQAFPGEETPSRLMQHAAREVDRRRAVDLGSVVVA